MSKNSCDVAVIGGGVIGLACAWRLAQRGAKVHLFERGQIGREASWAAAGMLAAQCEAAVHPPQREEKYSDRSAFFDLCLQSRALYPALAEELLEMGGQDVELCLHGAPTSDNRKPGILFVGDDDDRAFSEFGHQQNQGLEVVESSWYRRRAAWLPGEGQVENRRLGAELFAAASKVGVTIHENLSVERIAENVLRTSTENFETDKILLCGGAWSSQIVGIADHMLPLVRPVAGEVLALRTATPLEHIVYSREVYLVPRRDGRVLLGATMEERGFDSALTEPARRYMIDAAHQLVPDLAFEVIDHWAGLRPATPDGLPIMGSTPIENLFVATGHFRNGILLTPITAQLMADCILDGKEPPPEFSLARFEQGVLAA